MADLTIAICVLAACVFGASAVAKLGSGRSYRAYRAGLAETRLLPARLLPAAAAVLVAGEALVALALAAAAASVATVHDRASVPAEGPLIAAFVLTAILAGGVAVAVGRGVQARCPCFGASKGRPLGRVHVVRNMTLLAMLGCGLVAAVFTSGHPSAAAAITSAGAGAVLALLFTRWDDLAGVVAPLPRAEASRLARLREGHR